MAGLRPAQHIVALANQILRNITGSDFISVHLRFKDNCFLPLEEGESKQNFSACYSLKGVSDELVVGSPISAVLILVKERTVWQSIQNMSKLFETREVFIATHPHAWSTINMPLFDQFFGPGKLQLHTTRTDDSTKRWASEIDQHLSVVASAFLYSAGRRNKDHTPQQQSPPGLSSWAGMVMLRRLAYHGEEASDIVSFESLQAKQT